MISWRAHYVGGEVLHQDAGYTYRDIDRDQLAAFDLMRGGEILVRVDLRDDSRDGVGKRRLVWRKRTELDSQGKTRSLYMVGWQRTVEGRNIQAICYVFEDGSVLLGGQFDKHSPLMYPVVEREFEKG